MTTNCERIHRHILDIMPRLVRQPAGFLPFPYLVCSFGKFYPGTIYVWDHQHMAMRFAVAGQPQYLRFQVENLLRHQVGNGRTPNAVSAQNGPNQTHPPSHAQPFLMQATLMYLRQTGEADWTREVFPKLQAYLGYYDDHWRAPHGLFRWPLAYMSGYDNDPVTTFFQPDTIISPDVNALIYLEYRAAARVAEELNRTTDHRAYQDKAQALRKAINELLWNAEEGTYNAWNLVAGAPQLAYGDRYVKGVGRYAFQTCSNLTPLYARLADPAQAREMIEKYVLSEDHFLSPWGIRSLSKSSEYYNNAVWGNPPRFGVHDRLTSSNWQGPVWVPLCYFMVHALAHYGYARQAEDLADRAVNVLAGSLDKVGSFAENYDGETGAPLYCREFGSWNILADIMHDELRTNTWIMDPVFGE
jgi:glycogen debranching enzyme